MAYTPINKSTDNFNTKLYSGTGSSLSVTGVGFKPDFTWIKQRTGTTEHLLFNSIMGATQALNSNDNTAVDTISNSLTAFGSDGFTVEGNNSSGAGSGSNYASWNWLAGGSAPTKTYKVVVVSDGGNKYRFRNSTDTATFGTSAVTLDLQEGGTYTFDVSDSTMNSHPFVIGTAANSSEYSTGVTYKLDGVTKTYSEYTSGFSSATTRQLIFTVPNSAPALYYWCSVHSGMGGAINTNATHGSSNFDGAIQSLVTANTTSGFSIVRWTSNGANNDGIGHDLGATPKIVMYKRTDGTSSWYIWLNKVIDDTQDYLTFDQATKQDIAGTYSQIPTTSIISNFGFGNNNELLAYCFSDVAGFSKFGSYSGNGDADGPFIYTGFKPTFVLLKRTDVSGRDWFMLDSKRDPENEVDLNLYPNQSNAEADSDRVDFYSNGFKQISSSGGNNASGGTFFYMAFGQSIVGGDTSQNIPATAR